MILANLGDYINSDPFASFLGTFSLLTLKKDNDILSNMVLQDILNNLLKLIKSIGSSTPNDLSFKLTITNVIRHLIKEKMTNNFTNRQDIFKLILNFLKVSIFFIFIKIWSLMKRINMRI